MRTLWIVLGLAVVGLALTASQTNAAVLVTVKTELAPGQTGIVDGVNGAEPNVLLNVYAYFSGTDKNYTNDGLVYLQGAMKSVNGMLGNLSFSLNSSLAGNSGSSSGTQQDLDTDGDLDVGGTSASSTAGWIMAYSPSVGSPIFCTDSNRILLGQVIFTLSDANAKDGWTTKVAWSWRNTTGTQTKCERFYVDGSNSQVLGTDASLGTDPGVTITFDNAPEPGTLALLGLGGIGVIFVRRKRAATT